MASQLLQKNLVPGFTVLNQSVRWSWTRQVLQESLPGDRLLFSFLEEKNNNDYNDKENNQLEQNNWRRSCPIRMYNVDTFQRVSVIDVAITSWIVC